MLGRAWTSTLGATRLSVCHSYVCASRPLHVFLIFLLECGFHMFAHLLQTLTRLSQGLHGRYLPYIAEQNDQANRMQVNSLCSSTQLATGSDFGRSRPVVWILRLTTFSDGCGMLYPTKLTWGLQTIIYIFSGGSNQYSSSRRISASVTPSSFSSARTFC